MHALQHQIHVWPKNLTQRSMLRYIDAVIHNHSALAIAILTGCHLLRSLS